MRPGPPGPGSSHRKKRWCDGLVVDGTMSFPFLSRSGPFLLPSSSSLTDLELKLHLAKFQRKFMEIHGNSTSSISSNSRSMIFFSYLLNVSAFPRCKSETTSLCDIGQLCGSISSVRSWERRDIKSSGTNQWWMSGWSLDNEWIIAPVVAPQFGSFVATSVHSSWIVLDTQISQVKMSTVKFRSGALSMGYHCKRQAQGFVSSCLQSTSHD